MTRGVLAALFRPLSRRVLRQNWIFILRSNQNGPTTESASRELQSEGRTHLHSRSRRPNFAMFDQREFIIRIMSNNSQIHKKSLEDDDLCKAAWYLKMQWAASRYSEILFRGFSKWARTSWITNYDFLDINGVYTWYFHSRQVWRMRQWPCLV